MKRAQKVDVVEAQPTIGADRPCDQEMLRERLSRTEDPLGAVIDSVSDLVTMIDKDGVIRFQTPSSEAALGYRPEELVGISAFELVHPDDAAVLRESFETFARSDRSDGCAEARVRHRDGSWRILEGRGRRIAADQGDDFYVLTCRDMTEQKRLQKQVLKNEAYYRNMIDSSSDIIGVVDSTGMLEFQNAAAKRILGYLPEELIGRCVHDMVHPEDQDALRAALLEITTWGGKDLWPVEVRAQHKDGSWRVLEVGGCGKPAGDDATAFVLSARDITERRRTEESLRLTQFSIDQAADPVYWFDAQARVLYANKAGCLYTGYSAEEIRTRSLLDIDPGLTSESWPVMWGNLKERGSLHLEATHRTKAGETYPVEIRATYIEQGDKAYGFACAHDISDRKEAEAALETSRQYLFQILDQTVHALGALAERRDPYTAGHQQRVADFACTIGAKMGLNRDELKGLRVAALLHDIGKVAVPTDILGKPGAVSRVEMQIIEAHPETSYEIIKDIDFQWPVAEMVRQHHERLNGSGYPRGLRGEEILLGARILAVADVVEAMSSHRPNRPSLGIDAALYEIQKGRGVLYDERCVDACLEVLGEAAALSDQHELRQYRTLAPGPRGEDRPSAEAHELLLLAAGLGDAVEPSSQAGDIRIQERNQVVGGAADVQDGSAGIGQLIVRRRRHDLIGAARTIDIGVDDATYSLKAKEPLILFLEPGAHTLSVTDRDAMGESKSGGTYFEVCSGKTVECEIWYSKCTGMHFGIGTRSRDQPVAKIDA